jgi:hypothetical protein
MKLITFFGKYLWIVAIYFHQYLEIMHAASGELSSDALRKAKATIYMCISEHLRVQHYGHREKLFAPSHSNYEKVYHDQLMRGLSKIPKMSILPNVP